MLVADGGDDLRHSGSIPDIDGAVNDPGTRLANPLQVGADLTSNEHTLDLLANHPRRGTRVTPAQLLLESRFLLQTDQPAWLGGRVVAVHVKLAWLMGLALLAVGFVSYLAFEWSSSLGTLPWWHKLTNAAFQSITLRSAGFNSVDLTHTTAATQQIMMALMFVGGSPGGTAGGIKTTTAALLLLAVLAALRGRDEVIVLGKRVMVASVYRAAAVATLGVLGIMMVLMSLLLTQAMAPTVALFETVSALGTVGLSMGGTASLDGIGKVIVAGAMFVGRIGPLTLLLLLGGRRDRSAWRFPDVEVDVG